MLILLKQGTFFSPELIWNFGLEGCTLIYALNLVGEHKQTVSVDWCMRVRLERRRGLAGFAGHRIDNLGLTWPANGIASTVNLEDIDCLISPVIPWDFASTTSFTFHQSFIQETVYWYLNFTLSLNNVRTLFSPSAHSQSSYPSSLAWPSFCTRNRQW